jgi:hypothetical protein
MWLTPAAAADDDAKGWCSKCACMRDLPLLLLLCMAACLSISPKGSYQQQLKQPAAETTAQQE